MTEQMDWNNPYGFIATEGIDTILEPVKGYELLIKGVVNKV